MTSKSDAVCKAQGIVNDIGRLINDFVERNSPLFTEFTEVWRKHYFSLVFMGHTHKDKEFVNDVFKVTTTFVSSPSFYQRMGAVYLLYSLFVMQVTTPKIKIRLEKSQWRVIDSLRSDAVLNKNFAMVYHIDYLIKYGFCFVENQLLKGPLVGCMQKQSEHQEVISSMKANYKADILEYSVSNSLKALKDLHVEYLAETKRFRKELTLNLLISDDEYQGLESELQKLVNPEVTTKQKSESVGTRRAKLKAKSYTSKTFDRFGKMNVGDGFDSDSNDRDNRDNDVSFTKKRRKGRSKPRKTPKELRRIGRPRKFKIEIENTDKAKSDEEVDIDHLLSQQHDLYLPPGETAESIKRKTRRDPYYKLSPKYEKSPVKDPDDPKKTQS